MFSYFSFSHTYFSAFLCFSCLSNIFQNKKNLSIPTLLFICAIHFICLCLWFWCEITQRVRYMAVFQSKHKSGTACNNVTKWQTREEKNHLSFAARQSEHDVHVDGFLSFGQCYCLQDLGLFLPFPFSWNYFLIMADYVWVFWARHYWNTMIIPWCN